MPPAMIKKLSRKRKESHKKLQLEKNLLVRYYNSKLPVLSIASIIAGITLNKSPTIP